MASTQENTIAVSTKLVLTRSHRVSDGDAFEASDHANLAGADFGHGSAAEVVEHEQFRDFAGLNRLAGLGVAHGGAHFQGA